MATRIKNLDIEPIDYRYDEGFRGRVDTDVSPTITTKSSGYSGTPLLRERESMSNLRIRKLTPLECLKLMGFSEEDYNAISKEFSNSAIYHVAGDTIITTCLMSIFGTMLDVDYRTKVENYVEKLKEGV